MYNHGNEMQYCFPLGPITPKVLRLPLHTKFSFCIENYIFKTQWFNYYLSSFWIWYHFIYCYVNLCKKSMKVSFEPFITVVYDSIFYPTSLVCPKHSNLLCGIYIGTGHHIQPINIIIFFLSKFILGYFYSYNSSPYSIVLSSSLKQVYHCNCGPGSKKPFINSLQS